MFCVTLSEWHHAFGETFTGAGIRMGPRNSKGENLDLVQNQNSLWI